MAMVLSNGAPGLSVIQYLEEKKLLYTGLKEKVMTSHLLPRNHYETDSMMQGLPTLCGKPYSPLRI